MAVVQGGSNELVIWGPMSVELPSEDKKLIRLAAVERSLPGLLRRGRLTVMHGDTIVAETSPLLAVDFSRVPPEPALQAMVKEIVGQYGGLPTGIIPITQAIAAVFPRIKALVGQSAAFLGSTLYEDDRIGQAARQDVLAGRLDSYSLSGVSFKTRKIQWCDPGGCQQVDEVLDLDTSSVTLCSTSEKRTQFGVAKARNPGAAFVVVQQAQAGNGSDSMPFAGYQDFDACVAANGDKSDPKAYCATIMRAVEQAEGTYSTATPGIRNQTHGGCTCNGDGRKCPTCQSNDTGIPTHKGPNASPISMTTTAVTQADFNPAEAEKPKEAPPVEASEEDTAELRQRTETLEQEVALMKGKQPATAPPAEAEKPEAAEEDAKGDGKADEPKKEEQATATRHIGTSLSPELLQVVVQAAATAAREAVKDLLPSLRNSPEVPAPAPVKQAGTRVETPEPAQPKANTSNGMDAEAKRISQALDRGEPGAFREALLLIR